MKGHDNRKTELRRNGSGPARRARGGMDARTEARIRTVAAIVRHRQETLYDRLADRFRIAFEGGMDKSRESLLIAAEKAREQLTAAGALTQQQGERLKSFLLRDLGSHNGVYFAGKMVKSRVLNDGDVFVLGKYRLEYRGEVPGITDDPAPAPAPAHAMAADEGGLMRTFAIAPASVAHLRQSEQVKGHLKRDDGKFLLAMPLKLAMKVEGPIIAVVYKLDPPGVNARTLPAKTNKKFDKKYIHEIKLDPITKRTNLNELCDKLCE